MDSNQKDQMEMNTVEQKLDPVIPAEKPSSNNSKLIILVLAISTILASALAGLFYWQNTQLKRGMTEKIAMDKGETILASPTAIPTNDPAKNITDSSIDGWKSYNGKYYTVSFPENWRLSRPYSDTGFQDAISILSPTGISELMIGNNFDFPYGWGPDAASNQKNIIEVKVGDKFYDGELTKTTEYYEFASIYLEDLLVRPEDTQRITTEEKLHLYVRYGNAYPLQNVPVNKAEDPSDSYNTYQLEKQTINQILSTFKFLNESGTMEEASDSAHGQQ